MTPAEDAAARIRQNLEEIRGRMADAARRSGRPPESVTLVAVTKYVDPPLVRKLVNAGCRTLGESRPQQLWQKAEQLADLDIQWHLVGHLQRNKVRRTLPYIGWLHSADSIPLLEALEHHASQLNCHLPTLLEVNISGEASKHGFAPEELPAVLEALPNYPHVAVRGLMAMARLQGGPAAARADFAALRELRDRLKRRFAQTVCLDELSMGMSGDFEVAIEEGATMVRIGSALFEGVRP